MIVMALFLAISLPWAQAFADSCQSDCELILGIPEVTEDWRQNEYRTCLAECSPTSGTLVNGLPSTLKLPGQAQQNKEGGDTDKKLQASPQDSSTIDSNDTQQAVSCKEDFDAEVSACEAATLKAASSCDENNSAMSNVVNMAAQVTLYAGQKGAMGIQESCSKMASVAKAANAALMSYRVLCNNSIIACTSACSRPLTPKCNNGANSAWVAGDARSAMTGNLSSCQGFSAKISQATLAAQSYSQMQMNSQSCALLTSGAPATLEICTMYPDYPGCNTLPKMDCSNPEMTSNKVCICSKNPTDPICMGQSEKLVELPSNINPSSRVKVPKADLPNITENSRIAVEPKALDGVNSIAVDGKQGPSVILASPSLSPSMVKRLKEKKEITNQVLGGFYQSESGSTEKRYEKLDLTNKLEGSQTTVKNTGASTQSNPGLSRFLPGQFNPRGYRGLAGNAEKVGVDGITGPHSNIWKKIQNRYKAVQDSLHP